MCLDQCSYFTVVCVPTVINMLEILYLVISFYNSVMRVCSHYLYALTLLAALHTHQQAMEVIGFQPDEISATLELLASVLNLGNVSFVGNTLPDGTDSCSISDMTCKQLLNVHACTY